MHAGRIRAMEECSPGPDSQPGDVFFQVAWVGRDDEGFAGVLTLSEARYLLDVLASRTASGSAAG